MFLDTQIKAISEAVDAIKEKDRNRAREILGSLMQREMGCASWVSAFRVVINGMD